MERKRKTARLSGREIKLDYKREFLNSTDYGTLIAIIQDNTRDFATALEDPNLTNIHRDLQNIASVRNPKAHADETYVFDENVYLKTKQHCQVVLDRFNAYLKN